MAFEEVKENLTAAELNVRAYIDNSTEYYKLKGFKFLMKGITSLAKILLIGAVALMVLLFLSIAAAFGIGQELNNTFLGFLIIGGIYILISIILVALRKILVKPILEKFSEFYFDEL